MNLAKEATLFNKNKTTLNEFLKSELVFSTDSDLLALLNRFNSNLDWNKFKDNLKLWKVEIKELLIRLQKEEGFLIEEEMPYLKVSEIVNVIYELLKQNERLYTSTDLISEDFLHLKPSEQLLLIEEGLPLSFIVHKFPQLEPMIIKSLAKKTAFEPMELSPEVALANENPIFRETLSFHTNNSNLIMSLLSQKDTLVEQILINRYQRQKLILSSPGLFSYWGMFNPSSQKLLIKSLHSYEEFLQIARFLILHTNLDDGFYFWHMLLNSSLKEKIINFLKENSFYLDTCKTKWPELFF